MSFKVYFNQINEINENTILYHRSYGDYEPNQILNPKDKYSGGHPYQNSYLEKKLEEFRQENAPDKPSRMSCVFCSVVPRAAFVGRGHLYEVKPIGNFHVTLSYYINFMLKEYEDISYTHLADIFGPAPSILSNQTK